jgi:hypothetical protein
MRATLTDLLTLMLLAVASAAQAQSCPATDLYLTATPPAASTSGRPFGILAFGTSIMWGDGLLQPHTMRYQIADWVSASTRRPVQLTTFAHSAALLGSPEQTSAAPLPVTAEPGDLNNAMPTVDQQIACAAATPTLASAELILVEGCINDIGAERIAYPWTESGPLITDTDEFCGKEHMGIELKRIASTFHQATVVVVGYYPLISSRSSIFGFSGTRRAAKRATHAYERGHPTVVPRVKAAHSRRDEANIMVKNSELFYKHSRDALIDAVQDADAAAPGTFFFARLPEVAAPLGGLTIDPIFAYGAPRRREWMIPIRFLFFWAFYKDEKYWPRQHLCSQHLPLGMDRIICDESAAFHPNRIGEDAYTQSIKVTIPPSVVERWQRQTTTP